MKVEILVLLCRWPGGQAAAIRSLMHILGCEGYGGRLVNDLRYTYGGEAVLRIVGEHQPRRKKLKYIHQNPVSAGLVSLAEQYHYSSPKFYEHGTDDF